MKQTQTPIYNSRLVQSYLQYLRRFYPDVDISELLSYADMTTYEAEDPAHWFSQNQMDRFHRILDEKTAPTNISREAGRFITKAENMGPARQFTLGMMNVKAVFLLLEKMTPLLSRGSKIAVKSLGPQKIEVISHPLKGVQEKPYQCENRMGIYEGLPRLFTEQFAQVSHPECLHRGDDHCRYVIRWRETAAFAWKRLRNLTIYAVPPAILVLALAMPFSNWLPWLLGGIGTIFALALKAENVAKKELARALEAVSLSAKTQIDEARIHYTNARVVQEVGQIAASNLDVDLLLQETVGVLKRRLAYEQCCIYLYEKENNRLMFATGYGCDRAQLKWLQSHPVKLTASEAKLLRSAIEKGRPIVANTPWDLSNTIFPELRCAADSEANPRGIIVPLVTNQATMGLLTVLESEAVSTVTTSDINFLLAIASQVAVGINNATAFRKLQESESKFRQILESIQEGYFEVNRQGQLIYVNPALCRITGYSKRQLYAMDVSGYADSATRNKLSYMFEKVTETGQPVRLARLDFVGNEDRQLTVELSATPIRDKNGRTTGFRGIIRDVSERIQAEKERERLEQHLQQIQKLESIGKLAGGIAHNFNNMLMGIQGNISLINLDIDPEGDLAEKTANIEAIISSASKLTGQLLGFARGGKYQLLRVDLNDLIESTSETFAMTQRNIRVHRKLMGNLPLVEADRNQMEQVLWNLYVNAADAMPEGGEIFIETQTASHTDLKNKTYDVKKGQYALLRVTDKGEGMDPETLERVFEPFFTTKEVGKGTGLGLASVYGIIKSHYGYIEVESAVGKGTTFYLFLPVCKVGNQRQSSDSPQLAAAGSRN
jgi:PAS domain S-box-containing protein